MLFPIRIFFPLVFVAILAASGCGGGDSSPGSSGTSRPICAPGTIQSCYTGPPATLGVGICKAGTQTCLADGAGFGPCIGAVLPAAEEACDTPEDDDCDGMANEPDAGCVCTKGATMFCYDGPPGTEGVGVCKAGTQTCATDGKSWGACMGQVLPAQETCDTPVDDDCNGMVNEGGIDCACVPGQAASCYSGAPATEGVGPCKAGLQVCNVQGTGFGPCMGEALPQPETCNTPIDDNCDGMVNEGGSGCVCLPNAMVSCYSGPQGTAGVGACKAGLALCNDQGTALGPCLGEVLPQPEMCNTPIDDNCNGMVNEGCGPTYSNDVQPIFLQYCSPCHAGGGAGGADLAVSYKSTQVLSYSCLGQTKGACALVRIQNGSMPQGGGCTGNPALDAGNPACLTASDQATLQAWIADGQPP